MPELARGALAQLVSLGEQNLPSATQEVLPETTLWVPPPQIQQTVSFTLTFTTCGLKDIPLRVTWTLPVGQPTVAGELP